MNMIQLQEQYVAALHKAEQVTTRYGNQRKARAAAHKQIMNALLAKGYDEKTARMITRQAYEVFTLELNSED